MVNDIWEHPKGDTFFIMYLISEFFSFLLKINPEWNSDKTETSPFKQKIIFPTEVFKEIIPKSQHLAEE